MSEFLQVSTTVGNEDEAQRIARALLERRLAACVQVIGPITSHFRWEGEIETSQEWLCLAKARAVHYAELEKAVRELHSYEVAEIIAVPIVQGSCQYLAWMRKETL